MLERKNDLIRYAKVGILGGAALGLGTACIPGITSPSATPTPDALSALTGGRRVDSTPTPGVASGPDYRATATSLQAENDRLRANTTSTVVAGGKEITPTPTQVAIATGTPTPRTIQATATSTSVATRVAVVTPRETTPLPVTPQALGGLAKIEAAEKRGAAWIIRHPDQDKTQEMQLPEGFTPDRNLHFATDIRPATINSDLSVYRDWDTLMNDIAKPQNQRYGGYNYDYNDFCMVPGFECNVQSDMYAWRTLQGEEVRAPGIGILKGGPRTSVVLNILNLDASVHAWDIENNGGPVYVKHGFTATGRIWNGERNVDVMERNLSGHWLFRQGFGTPEKSYLGITNDPDNALKTLLVSVQRKQWGNNPDGSKRYEFQLIRAELVGVK